MTVKLARISILFSLLLVSFSASAGRVDKAYAALEMHDYFKAKKLFTKALKYNSSAASQGLSIIFYRTDNPFHNYDSAYVYVQRSIEGWDMEKARKKEKWEKFGYTQDSLYSLRQAISTKFYEKAKQEFTEQSFNRFILEHPWAVEQERAIELRDSIAFFAAVKSNTASGYKSFLGKYPNSTYVPLAQENFYDSQFEEMTGDGSLESYLTFIDKNPESPLREEAEENVYDISTASNTPAAFESFIQTYPENSYIHKAWKEYYQNNLGLVYSKDMMESFLAMEGAPIKDIIQEDLMLFDSIMLPFQKNSKYGFMNVDGAPLIKNEFDFTGFFQEGLAVAVKDGKYGFINKRGEVQIPFMYESAGDFSNGRAVVELNGRMGMIDRNNRFLFKCIYEDLGSYSESLVYAQADEKYGYYDESYSMVIPHIFDDAYDFTEGTAKVEKDGLQAFIDKKGEFVVPLAYEQISRYTDTLYIFSDDGLYGIMNQRAQIFVEPMYSSINAIHEGLAVAAIEDRLVYLDSSGVMVIDNGYNVYPNFQLKGEFTNGTAIVYKKEKYGRINQKDEIVTKFNYENIGMGKDYFPAQKDGSWGIYSAQGNVLTPPAYDALVSTGHGNFIAVLNDTAGVIDPNGNIVVAFSFDEIESLTDDLLLVRKGEKFGVYKNEKLIVPVLYDQIGVFDKDFLFLSKAGMLSYYNISEGVLVELVN